MSKITVFGKKTADSAASRGSRRQEHSLASGPRAHAAPRRVAPLTDSRLLSQRGLSGTLSRYNKPLLFDKTYPIFNKSQSNLHFEINRVCYNIRFGLVYKGEILNLIQQTVIYLLFLL